MTVQLPIVHWNDVYRVRPQKLSPRSIETIDVTQFSALLDDIRSQWPKRGDGSKDGLSLFSGDLFSPSTESSVTRGSHMVPVINHLSPDVSLLGNHDFDFGYPHLCSLLEDTQFPWLLSNVMDVVTGSVPEHTTEFYVVEKAGIRIGVIGLIEKEWIGTISSWPANFQYRDMSDVGRKLSEKLRDPKGHYRCDLIIALTHARVPNDIALAKSLMAFTPSTQKQHSIANEQGVDLILGGHDHLYYVARGVDSWEGYDLSSKVLGAEGDVGDVMVIKSGTDFRDLTELTLDLEDAPEGSIRRKLITRITGKHHEIKSSMRSDEKLKNVIDALLRSVGSVLNSPLCKLETELDLHSQVIRTQETASANWFADILLHTYDDALCMKGVQDGADGVFVCAGMLRGDSTYGPGFLTMGDVLEILPFEDPLVVLEVDGKTLWDTLEAALSTFPAQEGRFPVISGFSVSWDSRRPPGQRVLEVRLSEEIRDSSSDSGMSTPLRTVGDVVKPENGGRKYYIVTRDYMAQGHDGFTPLKGKRAIIDDESGQIPSSIVRKYLLGAQFVNKLALAHSSVEHLDDKTHAIIAHERKMRERGHKHHSLTAERLKKAVSTIVHNLRSRKHYRDHINVTAKEHMSPVDCFDGDKVRKLGNEIEDEGSGEQHQVDDENPNDEDLLVVHPSVDGRLKDVARPNL